MLLDNFYYYLEESTKNNKMTINKYGRKEYKQQKTQSSLETTFDYYYHAETGVIVGLAGPLPNNNFKHFDFININTGLSVTRNGRCYYATKQIMKGRGVYVGQYKPLDPQLLQFIKKRQERIIRNSNKKYCGELYE